MKSKTVKTIALLGLGYLAWKAIKGGGLMGLADDFFIPTDINPPVMQFPYGVNPYQYGGYPSYGGGYPQYGGGYPYSPYGSSAFNYYGGYPYNYGTQTPPAAGFYYNPYGGQSYYGQYQPRVVTPSGGVQGLF